MKPVIHAPGAHGELACDPPLPDLPKLLGQSASSDKARESWHGRLRSQARQEFSRNLPEHFHEVDLDRPWVGTGHQPELFHPGVWAKNFIAGGMGAALGNPSLNVVIDTDSPKEMGIRLPDLAVTEQPRRSILCPFTNQSSGTPWAQIPVNPDYLGLFARKLEDWAEQASFFPLAKDWLGILKTNQSCFAKSPIWVCFQRARTQVEAAWGLCQPSLPMSRISRFNSFHGLIRHFLMDLGRGRRTYNEALDSFRAFHQITTPGRPVPYLEERDDGWGEAPLWILEGDSKNRGRLWIKEEKGGFLLAAAPNNPCPHSIRGDVETGLERLAESGVILWPRALFTTLYLRTFVFDWFVHGIGGALYDQITEDWAARWLKISPGPIVAASLTLRLPLAPARSGQKELRNAQHLQHHLHWNPDLLLAPSQKDQQNDLMAELLRLRGENPEPGTAAKRRFHAIRKLIERLRDNTRGPLDVGWDRVARLRDFVREEQLVNNREFAYPLHPIESLRKHLEPLLQLRETAPGVCDQHALA